MNSWSAAKATFQDGVLEVRVPKTEEAKKRARKVEIESLFRVSRNSERISKKPYERGAHMDRLKTPRSVRILLLGLL